MPLLTLFDAKNDLEIKTVIGASPSSPDFVSRINAATRQLMRRGNWWGTVQTMQACVSDGCVVWPRQVETVLAVNMAKTHINLFNHWYEFLAWSPCGQCLYGSYKRGESTGIASGTVPVYRNIPKDGTAYNVVIYIDNQMDAGKTIAIYGIDNNGQTIRSVWPDGSTREGIVMSLGNVNGIYSQSVTVPFPVQRIDRITKDVTLSPVRVFAQDTLGNLTDLGVYAPQETSPAYVRTKLPGPLICNCTTGQITALVKLAFIPVVNDSDLILIDNLDALRDMIQAIAYKEAGDMKNSAAYEMSAIHELNSQMRTRFPDEQVTFQIRSFGTAEPWKSGVGRVI